jgi:hypothetical protein
MILLSDGSFMAQQAGTSNAWYKLTPGSNGGYASSGTWSTLTSMNLQRLYFASNVLPDGQVFVLGGEYSGSGGAQNLTNTGEIYDPVANTWTSIANFPQGNFGDDPSMVLDNGQVLLGYVFGAQTYLYNPAANTYTQTGSKIHNSDRSDEETWLKLPDGSVLSYDVFNDVDHGQSTAQRYIPSTGTWVDAGTVPVDLSSSALGYELGGATMLPDGRAWYVGATGHTAIYTPSTNTWTAGPDLPNGQHADDAPLCPLTNGHVLLAADGPGNTFSSPTHIYDYDPVANTFTEVDPAPLTGNNGVLAFTCRMLALPNGRACLEEGGSNQLYVYTPDSGPSAAWAPTISGITSSGSTFTLTGTQLNGISGGASYGDDAEMDSNFPIVEYLDGSGNFHFARTFNWSSTAVQTGSTLVSANYTLPAGIVNGAFRVQVVANGITSAATLSVLMDGSVNNVMLQVDGSNSSLYDVFNGATLLSQWTIGTFSSVMVTMKGTGGTVTIKSTPSGVPVNVYGGGTSTINIGNAGSLAGIQGPIDLENPPSFNTINIDDSADTTAHAITLSVVNNTTILHSDNDNAVQLSGLAPATITWEGFDTTSATIRGGTGGGASGGNTWNILGNRKITNIVAGAHDTVNVGNAGSVQDVLGTLNIENPSSFNVINLDDSADPNAVTATVRTLGTNSSDSQGNSDPWGQVVGLAPGTINFEYGDTSSVTVQTGTSGSDVVNVQQTQVATNVIGHALGMTVNVGSAGSVAGIQSPLTIEDPASFSNVNVDDSADTTARTVTLSIFTPSGDTPFGSITGLGAAAINYEYGDTDNVSLSLGNAANTVNAQVTGGISTTINLAAAATVNVTNAGSAQGIGAPLAFSGPAGSLTLTVDDSADSATQTVAVSTSGVAGLTGGAISFTAGQLAALTLKGGSGNDTWDINGTNAPMSVTAGSGNNTFVMTPASQFLDNIQGAATLTGGAGSNTLTVDDQADSFNDTYSIAAGSIQRNAEAAISYSGIGSVTLNGSSSAAITYDVNGTAAGVSVTINAASGSDTFNLGTGSLAGLAGPVTVNGGGTDSATLNDSANAAATTYTITSTTVAATGGFAGLTYSGLAALTLNAGNSGANTLIGPNTNNTWNLASSNAGFVGNLSFTSVQNLTGGTGNDTFHFAAGAALTGTINGGVGFDTLDYSAYATGVTVNLRTGTATGTGGVTAVQNVTGTPFNDSITGDNAGDVIALGGGTDVVNGGTGNDTFILGATQATGTTVAGNGGTDTLVGATITNIWTLTGARAGNVNSKVTFSGIANLVGGTANDSFKFKPGGSVPGTVNGGGGTDTLDFSADTATAVSVNLQTATATFTGGFSNITNVVGDTATTLTGPNTNNVWTITGADAGNVNGTFAFSKVLHLAGGTGNDNFTFTASTSKEITIAGGGGSDTLTSANITNTWTISSAGGGKLNTTAFSGITNLVGGSGLDVFKFTAGSVAGTVSGGGAPAGQGDWLDYSSVTYAVTVNLATGAASHTGGVSSIQDVHGGNHGNNLTGSAQGNILIGGAGSNTIQGGSGMSLLIGDKGPSTVNGGSTGGDILIADSTTYDTMSSAHEAALMAILAEWQSADGYATRFSKINTGSGMPGGAELNWGTTVLDGASPDAVKMEAAASASGVDWFFADTNDTTTNFTGGDHLNNT